MKFQPGQSGNPAGRPLALALPNVSCADDAQVAFNIVIEAFGRGEITVREFSPMLGSVDRMARVAERIQQNRAREHERYKAQRVHGIHSRMIPKPTGERDRLEPILAAIERGEDPFPDDPVRSAYVVHGADLYSPVNSDAPSLPRERSERGEGGSPECSEGETRGGLFVAPSMQRPLTAAACIPLLIPATARRKKSPQRHTWLHPAPCPKPLRSRGSPPPARSAVGRGQGWGGRYGPSK